LRRSHTKQDVHWRSETDVWSIDHINVTILLPGERTFAAPGVNAILAACRDQDQVWQVALYLYPARTIDEAYRQATQLAQEWHLDTADLESWYHGVLAGKRQGIKDSNEAFSTGGMGGGGLARGGPIPFAEIVSSHDEQRPAVLLFYFTWDYTDRTCQTLDVPRGKGRALACPKLDFRCKWTEGGQVQALSSAPCSATWKPSRSKRWTDCRAMNVRSRSST
jgi:hypothetical protein